MTTLYDPKDLSAEALKGATIAIVGYGSQGRAHALNLRDSGHHVLVGLRPGGASWSAAHADGFDPTPMGQAVSQADVVAILVPDPVQPSLFSEVVAPQLKPGALLLFAHGFNVHFEALELPDNVDVGLVAPKGRGLSVGSLRRARGCPPSWPSIRTSAGAPSAHPGLRARAGRRPRRGALHHLRRGDRDGPLWRAGGPLRRRDELVVAGWETLVEAGYSPEVAYFECLHELKLIVDLLYEGGLGGMHRYISETASYGDLTQGGRVVDERVRQRMRGVLNDIQSGRFAEAWREENERGRERYEALLADDLSHPIEEVGARLRAHMPWLNQQSAS